MIIDSHQHFWKYNEKHHAWITDRMSVIKKDFLPQQLEPVLKSNGVDGCIAVQAEQTELETDFLLSLAQENDFIKGVVGWLDIRANNFGEKLSHYSKFADLKGLRHIIQDEPPGFMMQRSFKRGIRDIGSCGLVYDILVYPSQLEEAFAMAYEFDDQVFVLDHLGKPDIANGEQEVWYSRLKKFRDLQHVYCKISGMVTEATWNDWEVGDFSYYVQSVFEIFGAERVMFGSDWPVCLLSADYGEVKSILETNVSSLLQVEKEKLWGLNALRVYSI